MADVNTLFSTNIFFSMFGNFIGSNLFKKQIMHPKIFIIIGACIGIIGCCASSYTDWDVFRYLFPATYGLAVGFTFLPQLMLSWKYLPDKIPLLTGLFNSCFGLGAFIFTSIAIEVVNPHGESPTDRDSEGNKLYPSDVADEVPFML